MPAPPKVELDGPPLRTRERDAGVRRPVIEANRQHVVFCRGHTAPGGRGNSFEDPRGVVQVACLLQLDVEVTGNSLGLQRSDRLSPRFLVVFDAMGARA